MKTHRLAILSLMFAVFTLACAGRAPVSTTPPDAEVQAVREFAVRVADATRAGLTIADETARLVQADALDCAILKVTGTTTPATATVTSVCGAVPLRDAAPLPRALRALGDVATCPSLQATVQTIRAAVDPLVATLAASPNQTFKLAAISLQATFAVLALNPPPCAA